MSQQPNRTMYQEKMTQQQPNRTGTPSQSNLLRPPMHCSRSLLSNAVSALLAGHALTPVHPQPGVNSLVQPTMVNRMVPVGNYQNPAADMNQRRMMMEMRQQLQRVVPPPPGSSPLGPPPGFKPLPPPPGFPPRPQSSSAVNTRLELKQPSSLSMPVGSYIHNQYVNQLRYSQGDQTRGTTEGAVNPTVQQQVEKDKGKRPLLADQANPNEQAAKKRAVESSTSSKPKYNPITQRMMDMKANAQRNGIDLLKKMPSVSTKRIGPESRKVRGFLYNYGQMLQENNGEDVSIICSCHGRLLSPVEFVKHAGGDDVGDPMKHISVNVMVSAPPVNNN